MSGPVLVDLPLLADTMAFGAAIGAALRPGDLVILSGDLGAGKTALTKGIAVGMGITEMITSPTFVLARVHSGPGTTLVHVDAYRLGGALELEDLDLDTDLARAAVVVEWGEGLADGLTSDPLHIKLIRHPDDTRTAELSVVGDGWRTDWAAVATAVAERSGSDPRG